MTAVRKQIKLEEDEDAAQLKFPSEFKTADALLISEVHMLLKVMNELYRVRQVCITRASGVYNTCVRCV